MESDEIGENHDIPPDSEEEGDLTGLTTIWSRKDQCTHLGTWKTSFRFPEQ